MSDIKHHGDSPSHRGNNSNLSSESLSLSEEENTGTHYSSEGTISNASSEHESNSTLSNAQVNPCEEEEVEEDDVGAPVEAIPVNECDLEENIRQQIINEAVQAEMIHTDIQEEAVNDGKQPKSRRFALCLIGFLTTIFIAVLLGVILPSSLGRESNSNDGYSTTNIPTSSPTAMWRPILQRIHERGFLRCGVFALEENVDWWVCKAVAAAVLGEPKIEYVRGDQNTNFERLRNHTIDLVASSGVSWERRAMHDIVFLAPPIFDGMGFSGIPKYAKCTDGNPRNRQECSDMKICVPKGSPAADLFEERLPKSQFLVCDTHQTVLKKFFAGVCNVISSNSFARSEYIIRKFGFKGEFYFGRSLITKNPYSPASLADDPKWADFINMVIQSLVVAERLNITQENANTTLEKTNLFGIGYENMFINAIKAVGNFGQAYQEAFPNGLPRGILEEWNTGSSGLLFAYDLGNPDMIGPGPVSGGTLDRIIHRGSIRCGIHLRGLGSSQGHSDTYEGLDIEYCRALAASVFQGRVDAVEFVELENETDGFIKISNGDLDIVAGAIWNLEHDVHEETTGEGYTFSPPYFYGFNIEDAKNTQTIQDDNHLCLLTSETDFQWSSFVECIVLSLIYAEENGITSRNSNDMPEVFWFGKGFRRIFRDAIFAVGNYGEVYEREMSNYIPRGGRNMLNDFANPGPQLYVPPGLLQLK